MAYNRTNWVAHETKATAQRMNNIEQGILANETAAAEAAAEAAGNADGLERVEEAVQRMNLALADKVDGAYAEDGYLYLTSNDEIVAGPLGPFAGGAGGGSAGNNAVISISNTSGWMNRTVARGDACPVSFRWSSVEEGMPTGNGSLRVSVGGSVRATLEVRQGEVTVDAAPYLAAGNNTVALTVSDTYGNARTIRVAVTVVELTLESAFDDSVPYTGAIRFPFVPTGSVAKTVHFLLDDVEIGTMETSVSGRQQTFSIDPQTHGAHRLRAYFEAGINGQTVRSNELYYEIICLEPGNDAPVIASSFRRTAAPQYGIVEVEYIAYNPASLNAGVTVRVNGETAMTATVDRTRQVFSCRAMEAGSLTIQISTGTQGQGDYASRSWTLTVSESDIDVAAETDSLALYLSAAGRSNAEEQRAVWRYNDISAALTGFNWTSDGWQRDAGGATALRVSGDARVAIPYQIFARDFRGTGKTIEMEFATRAVMNYDSTILSCTSGGRGLSLTAQSVGLASEQSAISAQFKEDEHVRAAFVVEKRSENRLICCYINGVLSGAVQYPENDDFSQPAPVGISIGSNDCAIDVYCIRVYDNDLTRHQILDNWIADSQDIGDMMARYEHNHVFDQYGAITIANLPNDLPYLVLRADRLPRYKGDKQTVSGRFVDPANPSRSFTFTGAQFDVQGTSSQYYARKNYKGKFKNGFVMADGSTAADYRLAEGEVPVSVFCFKADVASSEGANNVELARLYDAACPYKTPAQVADGRVRQGIDGFPIVIFHDDGENVTFIGKYNFNIDKGAEAYFGFSEGDESWEIRNNTGDRVLFKSDDYSGTAWLDDFEARYPDTDPAYASAALLGRFARWIVTTDQSAATGDDLPEPVSYDTGEVDNLNQPIVETYAKDTAAYRLAKFRSEVSRYVEVDSMLFYYLFTELFLMVDSRAKNMFPSFIGSAFDGRKRIVFLPYDFDTAIGINNEGALAFPYNLEDIDHLAGGADVFNGQQSVLWINVRAAFAKELKAMYQSLRSAGKLSYALVEGMFEAHQAKWPEAVFNEDAWYKYLQPLVDDGDGAYLSMLQGSKAEQRKWWLYNRFRYIDSKYNAGDALTDVITLRGYAKSNVTVTPYADVYASVKYGSYLVQARAARNQACTLSCPLDNVNDTEIYIYSASQLAGVGDLSGFKVGYANFSMATKLQSLKLGDADAGYENGNLVELYLGNNALLRTLDVRNCPALGTGPVMQAVDLSGCTNIEHVYFDGTSITGVQLPNGGILKTLHLPDTVTNLTIRNQTGVTDFAIPTGGNITTLRVENASAAVFSRVRTILSGLAAASRVRLVGFQWDLETYEAAAALYDVLDAMRGLDENGGNVETAQALGTIHIGALSAAQLASLRERYPDIAVACDHVSTSLRYYNYDGSQLLYTETILDGGDGAWDGAPSRTATAQYSFAFAGWSTDQDATSAGANATRAVTADRNVYAAYSRTLRQYTVMWKNADNTVLRTDTLNYGATPSWGQSMPTYNGQTARGWTPAVSTVTGNAVYTASYVPLYTATFVLAAADGGTTLYVQNNVPQGTVPTYGGSTPVSSRGSDYTFDGWSPALSGIQANTTYTAQFIIPVVGTITDTWDEIIAASANGTYASKYNVGDTKELSLGTEGKVLMVLVAKDADPLASGSGTAPMTWIADRFLKTKHRMNPEAAWEIKTVPSFAETTAGNNVWTSQNSLTKASAKGTWTLTALSDGTLTIDYKTSRASISDNKIVSLTVNGNTIVSNYTNTSYASTSVEMTTGDTVVVYCEYQTFISTLNIWATVKFNSTGTFSVAAEMENTTARDNSRPITGTGAVGGWESCVEMRSYLKNTVKPLIPSNVRSAIREVTKVTKNMDTSGTAVANGTSVEDVWIPSHREMAFTSGNSETTGPSYSAAFPDNASRIKKNPVSDMAEYWWLRSGYDVSTFFYTSNSGSYGHLAATGNYGVVIGFCI